MTNRIIGGNFSNNGKGGVFIGGGNVEIIGATANNNGGHGFHVAEEANVKAEDLSASGNEGLGLNIESSLDIRANDVVPNESASNSPHTWYQRPIGNIVITVFGGVLVLFVGYLIKFHFGIPL